jgi:hypothetical protein
MITHCLLLCTTLTAVGRFPVFAVLQYWVGKGVLGNFCRGMTVTASQPALNPASPVLGNLGPQVTVSRS